MQWEDCHSRLPISTSSPPRATIHVHPSCLQRNDIHLPMLNTQSIIQPSHHPSNHAIATLVASAATKIYIALAAAAITIFVHIARSFLEESEITSSLSLSSECLSPPRPLHAEEIIQRSYRQTFGALSTEILCSLDIDGKTCINSLLSEAMEISSLSSQSNNNMTSTTSTKSFPWWFITMLRDIKKNGSIHGAW